MIDSNNKKFISIITNSQTQVTTSVYLQVMRSLLKFIIRFDTKKERFIVQFENDRHWESHKPIVLSLKCYTS